MKGFVNLEKKIIYINIILGTLNYLRILEIEYLYIQGFDIKNFGIVVSVELIYI